MKFIHLVLGVCYFFVYHNSSALQIEGETFTSQTIAPRKRPTLVSLNEDCKLLIFERLNISELLTLIEADAQFSFAVENVLRRKLAKKTVHFISPYDNSERHIAYESPDEIKINNLPTVSKVVKSLGHLISKLMIKTVGDHYNDRKSEAHERYIFKSVNLHCSKTLTQLHIVGREFSLFLTLFNVIETPFEAVEQLILEKRFSTLNSVNLTFGQIFPAIKNVTLHRFEMECATCLDENYPHLKHFGGAVCDIHGVMHQFKTSHFKTFITNNPQIQSLSVEHMRPGLLHWVADALPSLEHIQLNGYSENCDTHNYNTSFEHLKTLEIFNCWDSLSLNISFKNLEEYVTDTLPFERSK